MENQEIQKLTEQIAMLEKMAKQYMSKEAISRYGNLKIAHPETAIKALTTIAQAAHLGQISEQLDDTDFKELLLEIQKGKQKFRFKK